jgi:hypothetical protein
MAYTMTILDDGDGCEYELPADTVTRDDQHGAGPLIPLGYRRCTDVFYIRSSRWPGLLGRPLRISSAPSRGR